MHTLTWEDDYLYWKDERAQPSNFQRNKFSVPFVVSLSLSLYISHLFLLLILLIIIIINFVSLFIFAHVNTFSNFRISILSPLFLGLCAQNLGDFCVFTVSSVYKVCPSRRRASTASAILESLVYFEFKVSPVIRIYVSFCTLLCRHYSVMSGVIMLILTIIM